MTTNEKIARALGTMREEYRETPTSQWVEAVAPDYEHDPAACVAAWPMLARRRLIIEAYGGDPTELFCATWLRKEGDTLMYKFVYGPTFCSVWVAAACEILEIEL